MEYTYFVPPFENKRFLEMNKKEALKFYEWYINEIPNRLKIFGELLVEKNVVSSLSFSPSILIPIWTWYEKEIGLRTLSDSQYQKKLSSYPEWMHDFVSNKELSFNTLNIGMDLAAFFAELFIQENKGKIKWGIITGRKRFADGNQPVLVGFKNGIVMNPRNLIEVMTLRSLKEKKETRLYDIFYTWMDNV